MNLIQTLYLISITLFGVGIFLFIFVIISRKRKSSYLLYRNTLIEKCQIFISELVFEDSLSPEAIEIESFLFKTVFRKHILSAELIQLHKNFHGEQARFLEQYYIDKGLHDLSFSKIKSNKNNLVSDGLVELSEMNCKNAIPIVKKLFHKVKDREMKYAFLEFMIKQDPEYGLQQLLSVDLYLSDWFQIKIINLLKECHFLEMPSLENWLSKNESYAVFGCRLSAYSQNHSEVPVLTKLLYAGSEDLKIAALKSLSLLDALNMNKELIIKYLDESDRVKNEIFNTLMQVDQTANSSFFEKIKLSSSEELRHLAFRALQVINFIQLRSYSRQKINYTSDRLA